MIRAVQDVYVNVSNMERALSFYGDLLGLRLVEESPHWSAFDVGGIRFGLHWTGGPDVPRVPRADHGPEAGAVVTFRVSDLFSLHDHLSDQGVTFLGEIESHPWGSIISFEDPDGNVMKMMS